MQKPFTTIDQEHLLLDAIYTLNLAKNNTNGFIKNFLKYSILTRPPYPNGFLCYNYELKRFQFYNHSAQEPITIVKPNKYSYIIGLIICVYQLQIHPMKSLIVFPVPVDQLINKYNHFKAHPDEIEEYLNGLTIRISEFISSVTTHEIESWKEFYMDKKTTKGLF